VRHSTHVSPIAAHHDGVIAESGRKRSRNGRAWALTAVAGLLMVLAGVGAIVSGLSWGDAVQHFLVTNAAIAVSFTACGSILAICRPVNPVGWLFLAGGLGYAITAAGTPLIVIGTAHHWPPSLVRIILTAVVYSWPWSIGLFLPLALLLFPDGRPPGRLWRWLSWGAVLTAPLFVVELGAAPTVISPGWPVGYLTVAGYDRLALLWRASELRTALLWAACLAALAVRYRRGGEGERRQLQWLILATLLTVGVLVPWGVFLVGSVLLLLAVPLVGAAVTVAILRYQLLDIRHVVSRTVLYLVLVAGTVLVFETLVAVLDALLRRGDDLNLSVLATVLVAIAFNPTREWLEHLMERALEAARSRSPDAVDRPGDAAAGFEGVIDATWKALRLPFVALRDRSGEICSSGTVTKTLRTIPLTNGTEHLGEILVGTRAESGKLPSADQAVLDLLATPLAVALHATNRITVPEPPSGRTHTGPGGEDRVDR
jgi:hypothetical protein